MRAKRLLIGATGIVATTVGLVGVLHMPFARNLLMDIGGCPVGHASLAELEPAIKAAQQAQRGTDAAPARPALGFTLDKTTRADAVAWAERAHVSCKDQREGLFFCYDVPAAAVGLDEADGPVSEVHFGFNTKGVLFDLATMRMNSSAKPATDIASHLATQLSAPPQKINGSFDEAKLSKAGPMTISTLSYHYKDYIAELTAMRLNEPGLVVREHYVSVTD